jgi:hypothetical protein
MRWKQSTGLILTAGVLSGCVSLDDEFSTMRYGPSPVLVAEAVQSSVARQAAVVAAVSGGATGFARDPVTREVLAPLLPADGDRLGWHKVILMGFNTIDDACMTYIDNLWVLERRKTRNSTILHAAGAAGAALIAAAQTTPSTAAALVILSQAFGFAGVLNNALADSYLYTQPAATIKRIIQKTTLEYRTDFAAAASSTSETEITYPIASTGAAYHHMREYLALCLPPTIQAQIDERLNGAKAIPEGSGRLARVNDAIVPASRVVVGRNGRAIRPTTAITLQ